MPPSYNEVTAWTPDQLRFIANGLFAMKARLDAEAPKAGNPVLNLTGAEWTGKARGPADDRAEAITRWLRGVADEYGDLADAMNRGAFSIEGAVTALENGTTSSESQGYVLNRGSREYEVTFEKAKAPPGAEYDANVAFQHQTALRNLGIAADQAVSDTSAAVNSALAALSGITPASISTSSGSMTRVSNQVDAFREVYDRVPVSDNDWRIAAALDPHSYNPKNKGAPPVVSVIKIDPVPGQGVVATGLFIPSERVVSGLNFSEFELKRNLGDARGFDPNFAPEDARVSYFIDYENGVIVARQNPSVDEDGNVKTGTPSVHAGQLPDGTVAIKYDASDPLAPPHTEDIGWSVRGQTIVTPGADGASVSGERTDFPSMETYQYMPDGRTRIMFQDDAGDHTEYGPLRDLPSQHHYGQYTSDLSRFPKDAGSVVYGPPPHPIDEMTEFGGADDPPRVNQAK
ncbi:MULTISPECIES: hypothetical protein [unclassified Gordonia (in: high G+C Gram-positive bacteria)]|uniref:hypothetical protein n=1 Tax=unclassified Gordonia (in: high G+C Gram-positive bacteria) TaxID=2657482 RepID=UPI001963E3BF|nr:MULTISPECIES: hypothetical protein [unclassified Gordonia (in: high G+C Gram-positive bacteria)]MBN0975579.1 hypothetical protein [Gordonia sp. BP-119]MBN0985704.1 hypothetical protein [Gordonia sp. BP-94]UCZ91976.1 hypothetical protein LEL84_10205 [Gordonia sp. WA4-43]WGJ84857.1 hypothetical protein QAD21_19260 [Gordonia sp. SMJS1]